MTVIVIAVSALIGWMIVTRQEKAAIAAITSFTSCRDARYPERKSYPPQCKTPDGRTFTKDIGNAFALRDEIVVDTPFPGQMLMSAFPVRGKARGSWFFEGTFSGELVDATGSTLGTVQLRATGEWMTTEFVPFTGQLIFKAPVADTGILKLRNANPSGLSEKQKELVIPIIF